MKRILSIILTVFISVNSVKAIDKYVILISVDGLIPEFYLEDKWSAVNMRRFKEGGVCSKGVISTFPSVTYTAHSTLITGATPAVHGIYYNDFFDYKGSYTSHDFDNLKAITLWESVKKAGGVTASIEWPITNNQPDCIDFNIPNYVPIDNISWEKTRQQEVKPTGFWSEIESNLTGKISKARYTGLEKDEIVGNIAAYIIKNKKPNLLTVHFLSTDKAQHIYGRAANTGVPDAVQTVDCAIGKIWRSVQEAGIEDKTAIIITGDHGFATIQAKLAPNTILRKMGLISEKGLKADWKAYFAYASASAFLHTNNTTDTITANYIKRELQSLPEYGKYFRIVEKDELTKIGADPRAHFAISPIKGIACNSSIEGKFMQGTGGQYGTHGWYPTDFPEIQSGFIMFGASIKHATSPLEVIYLQDIAPTVAEYLKIEHSNSSGMYIQNLIEENN